MSSPARDGSAIETIKSRLRLVDVAKRYIELRHTGNGRWAAPCPFHQETKPSFSISEEGDFFYCFGCQASGDLFEFYGRMHGLDFKETLDQLAEEAGVSLDKNYTGKQNSNALSVSLKRQCFTMYGAASQHYMDNLNAPTAQTCRTYLQERALSKDIISQFELGYSMPEWQDLADALIHKGFSEKEAIQSGLLATGTSGRAYDRFRGRLMFPIKDLSGHVIAFGGRIIAEEDQAKYINSSDSPVYKKGEHLYGLFQARRSISQHRTVLLTEGYMDVLTLHQFGYTNACGVLGTALTPEQVKRISGLSPSVELLFDGDKPGQKAAFRACEMFLLAGLKCSVVLMPQGEDIDSVLHKQGKEAFAVMQANALTGLDFCIRYLRTNFSPAEAIAWAKKFIQQLGDKIELAGFFISRLATGLSIAEQELRQGLIKGMTATPHQPARKGRKTIASPQERRDLTIIDFIIRYPQHFSIVQQAGARHGFSSPFARGMWEKMQQFGAKPENLLHNLEAEEREYWIQKRTGVVPPVEKEQEELEEILTAVRFATRQLNAANVMAALQTATPGDHTAKIELLKALQETLENTHDQT